MVGCFGVVENWVVGRVVGDYEVECDGEWFVLVFVLWGGVGFFG